MLHLSSWMTTLPIMVIGMVGIILVIGVLVFKKHVPHAARRARQDEPLGLGVVQQRQAKKRYGATETLLEAVMGLAVARLGVGLAFAYQADECGHGAGLTLWD